MAQKANLELVENLRPWIWKMISEYSEGSGSVPGDCSCLAGDNLAVSGGIISLNNNVVVGGSMSFPVTTSLVMWDSGLNSYVSIVASGGAFLVSLAEYTDAPYKPPSSGCVGGNNIAVSGGIVSLDSNVIIGNSLHFPLGTKLRMWDTVLNTYLSVVLSNGFMRMDSDGTGTPPADSPDQSTCIAGDNMTSVNNQISLADDIVIGNTLAIPANSSLALWDDVLDAFFLITMTNGFMNITRI